MSLTDQGNMVMPVGPIGGYGYGNGGFGDYERQKIQEEINRIRMGTR